MINKKGIARVRNADQVSVFINGGFRRSRLDCLLSGRGWLFRCQLLKNAIEQAKVEQKDGNRDEGFIF